MPELLGHMDAVACRACGAVRGPHSDESPPDICANCWEAFQRWRGLKTGETEDDFNSWLARKLFLDLRRLDRNGIVGRCEAISNWMYGRKGQQCALHAITTRDNRRVCDLHRRATSVDFVEVGDKPSIAYEMIGEMISRLTKKDERLLQTIAVAIGVDASPMARMPGTGRKGSPPIDITGRRFGRLVAIQMTDRVARGRHRYWLCRCDCGNEKEIAAHALHQGYHLSCGCYRKEASVDRVSKQQRNELGHFISVKMD